MDFDSKRLFHHNFWLNPVFHLEVARVECGVAQCVIPQQVFFVSEGILEELNKSFDEFLKGKISSSELFNTSSAIERQIKKRAKNGILAQAVEEMGLEIVPKAIFVNRILKNPPLLPDLQFFVGKRFSLKKIEKVERKVLEGKMDVRRGREELIRLEGRMLGYPECCVDSFVRSKASTPAESRLILQSIDCGIFDYLLDALLASKLASFPQFFTSNFYPCSPECSKARKVGERVERWLEDMNLASTFRLRTMVNLLYILSTAYRASRAGGEFAGELKRFFSSLDSEKIEVVKSVEKVIINITPFTNSLIKRIIGGFSEKGKSAENQKN